MLQSELNNTWSETLYYYYFLMTGLLTTAPLGSWSYDENYNLQIDDWTADCDQPSISLLLSYDLSTVLAFYSSNYTLPQQIQTGFSLTKMSSSVIEGIPTIALSGMNGYQVFDTTIKAVRTWSGSAWV